MLAVLARVKSRQDAIRGVLGRIGKVEAKQRELAVEQLAILAGLRGLADGRAEGERKVLRAQLKKRFGRLPVWAQKQLDEATAEQIEAWSLKLLDARKLEDVLGKR